MSSGDEPALGSGAYYDDRPGGGGGGPGFGGLPGLGGLFGAGGFPAIHPMGPQGPYGAWPTCGCSSLFIILAGILLVCGGCLRMFGQ
jgi:hypothetical protein